jgi:hypothetical protein
VYWRRGELLAQSGGDAEETLRGEVFLSFLCGPAALGEIFLLSVRVLERGIPPIVGYAPLCERNDNAT